MSYSASLSWQLIKPLDVVHEMNLIHTCLRNRATGFSLHVLDYAFSPLRHSSFLL